MPDFPVDESLLTSKVEVVIFKKLADLFICFASALIVLLVARLNGYHWDPKSLSKPIVRHIDFAFVLKAQGIGVIPCVCLRHHF